MDLAPVTAGTRSEFGLDDNAKGVVVTSVDPDSDAAAKGLQAGDLIMRVGSKDVRTPADVRRSIAEAKEAGRIINISSVVGESGNGGQVAYSASKAGILGLTMTTAKELASRGVTVNVVAPGVVDSPATAKAFPPERVKTLVPMQRAGTPEEVAALVGFLASDAAGYITGQVVAVAGGLG